MSDGIDFSKVDFDNIKPVKVKMIGGPRSPQFCVRTSSGNYVFYPRPMVKSWDMMACSWLGRRHIVLRAGKKHLRIKKGVKNGIKIEPISWDKRGLL